MLIVDLGEIYESLKPEQSTEGITTAELVEQTGWSKTRIQKVIRMAMQAGRCHATRKPMMDIVGRDTTVPAYVFTGEESQI